MTAKQREARYGTEARRTHVLVQARLAYRRLKRRRLIIDAHIWPDRSHEIVAVLAHFAYEQHAYLERAKRLGQSGGTR